MDMAILGVGYEVEYLNVLLLPLCSNITLTHIWGPPHNRAKISQILYLFIYLYLYMDLREAAVPPFLAAAISARKKPELTLGPGTPAL